MKMKDREIEKINSSDIRRLEKTLYKIDRHEKELITEFDNNIVNILGDALKPLLEEIKKNKNLIENIDTRIIKVNNQDYLIPVNFLQNFHKSYIENPQLKVLFEDKVKQWFKNKTEEIRKSIKDVDSYQEIERVLPHAYALSSLALTSFHKNPKMILRDVQKLTGIAISEGSIAELGTGEGKTLSAILPTYLYALRGKGAHVITANGYLARRDFEETLPIYEGLGLTSGFLPDNEIELAEIEGLNPDNLSLMDKYKLQEKIKVIKQKSYQCDITYGSKQTFAFDYLRDNNITRKEDMMQRGEKPGFALIDEVDDALIDDAMVPYRIALQTPMYHKNMTIRDLCTMQGISYEKVLPSVRMLGIKGDTLTYEEARYISQTFGHLELLNDPIVYQELADRFFRSQKVFVTEDNSLGFKRGKDLYEAILNDSLYDTDEIKNNYGIILCKELREYKLSDKCYDDFLKYCYLSFHINTQITKNQNKILNDPNYKEGKEYYLDSYGRVKLTMMGASKILSDENYPDFIDDYNRYLSSVNSESSVLIHYFRQAVTAHLLMKNNENYLVENGKVKTLKNGRVQEGSTYSNGLHQAIEIKEKIPQENRTKETTAAATITQKDFYSRYDMFSGMTGTSSKSVFQEIFGKATVEIPKHAFYSFFSRRKKENAKEPIGVSQKRIEFSLELDEKIKLIVNSIIRSQKSEPKQPVLLVVSDVDEIPLIQKALNEKKISYNTLTGSTAKEDEALIIARAGLPGAVTISTEMAGRGTDIKIGGDRDTIIDIATERHIRLLEKKQGVPLSFSTTEKDFLRKKVEQALVESPKADFWTKETEEKTREAMETIGLKVIASGFFKMNRIDRQLEGRTGRNGLSGVCEKYAYPNDLKRIGLTSLNMKDSIIDFLKKFKKKSNGALDIDDDSYIKIKSKIRAMQNNNESEIKDRIKNTQKLDSYATQLVERYRDERRKVICDTALTDSLTSRMIEDATDAIISSYMLNKELTKEDLTTPINKSKLAIDVEAISLETKQVLGISFDPNIVEKSNINLLELRDAMIRTANIRRKGIQKEKIKQALIVQNDYLIANIPEILDHSFTVKNLTSMSLGMESQADSNSEIEFDRIRRTLILEASKHGTRELLGIPLSKEEFKLLEHKKYKLYSDKVTKSETNNQEYEIKQANYQPNNASIIAKLKDIRKKLVEKNEKKIEKVERKISNAEVKGKIVNVNGLFHEVKIRPMMFVSAMSNGRGLSNLVLVRKSKNDSVEKEEIPTH